MRTLDQAFLDALNRPSDISEHLETIRSHAAGYQHVTEMGVRGGVSTWALLSARPKRLVCYDILPIDMSEHARIAAEEHIDFEFKQLDVIEADIEETDCLLIDTWHTYSQLCAELQLHSPRIRNNGHIILHDTYTFAYIDEPAYPHASSAALRWGKMSAKRGLRLALTEFVDRMPDWRIVLDHPHNNGLTILRRSA
jgi:predicted O-methyltransferase YrrM